MELIGSFKDMIHCSSDDVIMGDFPGETNPLLPLNGATKRTLTLARLELPRTLRL